MELQCLVLLILSAQGRIASVSTSRLKVLNLENVRVSWKVFHGSELVLNLYSKLVLRLPG